MKTINQDTTRQNNKETMYFFKKGDYVVHKNDPTYKGVVTKVKHVPAKGFSKAFQWLYLNHSEIPCGFSSEHFKPAKTLYTTCSKNIGQVLLSDADAEIQRLNSQSIHKWRKDDSDFMYIEDETDDNVSNPCELSEGYVWITCQAESNECQEQEPITNRSKALAWWLLLGDIQKLSHWKWYKSVKFTPSHIPSELTGREIEYIWENLGLGTPNTFEKRVDIPLSSVEPNEIIGLPKRIRKFDAKLGSAYIKKLDDNGKKQLALEVFNQLSVSDLKYLRACLSEIISETETT